MCTRVAGEGRVINYPIPCCCKSYYYILFALFVTHASRCTYAYHVNNTYDNDHAVCMADDL